MLRKYIVTVKLPKNPNHDPRNKLNGGCPVNENVTCTDVTGEHHSFLLEAASIAEAREEGYQLFGHVTRIEEVFVEDRFTCSSIIYHGPGHQSKTKCQRRDPHSMSDEHYAPDPTEAGFSWIGDKAYA